MGSLTPWNKFYAARTPPLGGNGNPGINSIVPTWSHVLVDNMVLSWLKIFFFLSFLFFWSWGPNPGPCAC
ncbi:rCG46429 [Rattus norvegicus]|uniref:RCG46429 n=1 Tax=Rattus norvegicus TaxID=10116 RepID=A6IDD6_RAT|nr:rCG46429 [Rattus norvegicus]